MVLYFVTMQCVTWVLFYNISFLILLFLILLNFYFSLFLISCDFFYFPSVCLTELASCFLSLWCIVWLDSIIEYIFIHISLLDSNIIRSFWWLRSMPFYSFTSYRFSYFFPTTLLFQVPFYFMWFFHIRSVNLT